MGKPAVAVVVPVHGRWPLTQRFLESFRKVDYPHYQIVIVDDGSPDETAAILARDYPQVYVIPGDGNLWWTAATNLGVRYALQHGFDYVLTINNDVVVTPSFLSYLVETAMGNPRSLVGSRINYLDRPHLVWGTGGHTVWDHQVHFPLQLYHHQEHECDVLAQRPNPMSVELLTGCGTLVPADCYRTVGLYDRTTFPHYHADADFTLRAAQRGYRILVDLRALVYNDEPQTCTVKNFMLLRSPWYWRPILGMHVRHCPPRRLFPSLWRQYANILTDQWRHHRRLGRLGGLLEFKRAVEAGLRSAA